MSNNFVGPLPTDSTGKDAGSRLILAPFAMTSVRPSAFLIFTELVVSLFSMTMSAIHAHSQASIRYLGK